MTKRSKAQLNEWFGKDKEPTGEQFADWQDSYYHKDENNIPVSAVEGLTAILNDKQSASDGEETSRKAEQALEEVTRLREDVDNTVDSFNEDIFALETEDERLHTDIENVRTDISTIRDMLKGDSTLEEAKAALIALGESYRDVYAIADTLKSFLEDSDTSTETINKWQEIEAFLDGITDTGSLTLLLEQLETKITTAYNTAISTAVNAEKTRAEAAETALGNRITGVRSELQQADVEIKREIDAVRQIVYATQADSEGRVIPLVMQVDYPPRITRRNPVPPRIKTQLLPWFALQNILYLGDGRAVDVEPDGTIVPLGLGKSRIHVIPTENTSLHKSITVEVVDPSIIKAAAGAMLLTGNGSIFLT